MHQIDRFTNDYFRTLAYLYDIKGPDGRARITQQEVADELEISRTTINKIMNELKSEGYIKQDGNHVGRYILMDSAVLLIETFRNINNK